MACPPSVLVFHPLPFVRGAPTLLRPRAAHRGCIRTVSVAVHGAASFIRDVAVRSSKCMSAVWLLPATAALPAPAPGQMRATCDAAWSQRCRMGTQVDKRLSQAVVSSRTHRNASVALGPGRKPAFVRGVSGGWASGHSSMRAARQCGSARCACSRLCWNTHPIYKSSVAGSTAQAIRPRMQSLPTARFDWHSVVLPRQAVM